MSYFAVIESSTNGSCSLGTFKGFGAAQSFAREAAKGLTPDGLSVVNVYRLTPDGSDIESLVPEITIDPREVTQ
jgi:hypothetical protein